MKLQGTKLDLHCLPRFHTQGEGLAQFPASASDSEHRLTFPFTRII